MSHENTATTKADLRGLATKKELHTEINKIARMVANGFATMATKEELHGLENKVDRLEQNMKTGFGLIMENLVPLRRDYEILKDDLAPQVAL